MAIPKSLLTQQNFIKRLTERMVRENGARLQDVFSRTLDQVNQQLAGVAVSGQLGGARFRDVLARYDLQHLANELAKAGYPQFQQQLAGNFQVLAQQIMQRKYGHLGQLASGGGVSIRALNSSLEDQAVEFQRLGNDLVTGLKRQIEQMTVAPVTTRQAAQMLRSQVDMPLSRAKTVINTGLAGLQRRLHQETAAALPGPSLFLWAGTINQNSRHMCRVLTGKVLTETQLAQLDNGHGLPVHVYAGGHN